MNEEMRTTPETGLKSELKFNPQIAPEALLEEMDFNLSDFALFLSVMKKKVAHENILSIITDNLDLELTEVHVEEVVLNRSGPVSYTHLDVYKRQVQLIALICMGVFPIAIGCDLILILFKVADPLVRVAVLCVNVITFMPLYSLCKTAFLGMHRVMITQPPPRPIFRLAAQMRS